MPMLLTTTLANILIWVCGFRTSFRCRRRATSNTLQVSSEHWGTFGDDLWRSWAPRNPLYTPSPHILGACDFLLSRTYTCREERIAWWGFFVCNFSFSHSYVRFDSEKQGHETELATVSLQYSGKGYVSAVFAGASRVYPWIYNSPWEYSIQYSYGAWEQENLIHAYVTYVPERFGRGMFAHVGFFLMTLTCLVWLENGSIFIHTLGIYRFGSITMSVI
jgi:hypothetical protein